MIRTLTPARVVVSFVVLVLSGTFAGAQTADPLAAYKAYLSAAENATSLDALSPYISSEFKGLLKAAPKAEVEKMLKAHVAVNGLTDLKVTEQKIDGDKAVLQMTARTKDGRATSGTATLVKESDGWKLDEDAWATPAK